MENLTKYSPAILNNNGVAEASMVSTNVGEFVKFSDIKELLQTAHNNARDEICPHYSSEFVASAGHCIDKCNCSGKLTAGKLSPVA